MAGVSLKTFATAFRTHWFAAMSGGVSVPFTALSVFLDNKWAQLIFAVLAFTAVWIAAYRIWKPERERVDSLEERLRPKVKLKDLIHRHEAINLYSQRNYERGGGGPFNLRAGENKMVRLCSRVDGQQRELDFCYETSEPHWAFSLRDTHECIVIVGIYGAPSPTIERLKMNVGEDGKMMISRMSQ